MIEVPTDTYLSYVTSRPLQEVWTIFLLTLARIVPTIAISPFLGGKALSPPQKIGFAISITFIFLPYMVMHAKGVPTDYDIRFMLLLIKEVFLGAIIGILISMPFYFAQSAGSLIDHQRGAQSLQVQNPITEGQTSPTGTVMADIVLVIFFALGGMVYFFEGVFTSYEIVPINGFMPPAFFAMNKPLFLTFLDLAHMTLKMTIQLSAPALLAMLMSDLFLGIANRMAPQVQITFLLYALKSFTGLGILALSWWLLLRQFEVETLSWLKFYVKIVESFRT